VLEGERRDLRRVPDLPVRVHSAEKDLSRRSRVAGGRASQPARTHARPLRHTVSPLLLLLPTDDEKKRKRKRKRKRKTLSVVGGRRRGFKRQNVVRRRGIRRTDDVKKNRSKNENSRVTVQKRKRRRARARTSNEKTKQTARHGDEEKKRTNERTNRTTHGYNY